MNTIIACVFCFLLFFKKKKMCIQQEYQTGNRYPFNSDAMSSYSANNDVHLYDVYSIWQQQQPVTHHGIMTGNIELLGQ